MTKQNVRNRQAKRWTKGFVAEEQADREDRTIYPEMPSPYGKHWKFYIKHRLKMFERGIATYTTDKYTRLNFDKYVQSNRVCDYVAGLITNHKPTLIHFGAAQTSPNSPISIKKHVRCPGNRKMLRSFNKCRHCHVNMVDEYFTSQVSVPCYMYSLHFHFYCQNTIDSIYFYLPPRLALNASDVSIGAPEPTILKCVKTASQACWQCYHRLSWP